MHRHWIIKNMDFTMNKKEKKSRFIPIEIYSEVNAVSPGLQMNLTLNNMFHGRIRF